MAGRASAKKPKKFTYADFLTWPEGDTREIIDGVVYDMTPSPSHEHQEILADFVAQFRTFLRGKKCRVIPDIDVVIPHERESDDKAETVVRPDLLVLCDHTKLDDKRVRGAPDLVLEIVSPSSGSYDAIKKRRLYERAGVKEFWLVQPANKLVMVFILEADRTFGSVEIYDDTSKIPVHVLPGLEIDMTTVFPAPVPESTREEAAPYRATKKKGARR